MKQRDELQSRLHTVRVESGAAREQMDLMVELARDEGIDRERARTWQEWSQLTLARYEEMKTDLEQAGFLAADQEADGSSVGLSSAIAEMINNLDLGCELLRLLEIVLAGRLRELSAADD